MNGLAAVRDRRFRAVLRRARRWYHDDQDDLGPPDRWSEQDRRQILNALRRWNVRLAAGVPPAWTVLFWSAIVTAGAVCVAGPVLLIGIYARPEITPNRVPVAIATYGLVGTTAFALLANWGAVGRLRLVVTYACGIGAAASLMTAATAVPWQILDGHTNELWPAVRLGLEAGVLGLFVAAIVQAVGRFAYAAAMVVVYRQCGSMSPSQIVAVQTYYLLAIFDRAQRGWRQADTRKRLLWATAGRASFIGRQIPRLQWLAGGSPHVRTNSVRRCQHAAATIAAMQWRLVEARSRSDFDTLRTELATAIAAAARGDWSRLTADTELSHTSRLITLLRRLVAPTVLAATALALPHLPAAPANSSSLASIQIGLMVAAVLTLASVDNTAQDRVLGALSGINGRDP